MKLWKYLKENMTKSLTQTLEEGEAKLTYEYLLIFAEGLGQRLSGTHYGILCSSDFTSLMALLACIYAERPAILLPMRHGIEPCYSLIERLKPPYIIHDTQGEIQILCIEAQKDLSLCEQDIAVVIADADGGRTMLTQKDILRYLEAEVSARALSPAVQVTQSICTLDSPASLLSLLLAVSEGRKIIFDRQGA